MEGRNLPSMRGQWDMSNLCGRMDYTSPFKQYFYLINGHGLLTHPTYSSRPVIRTLLARIATRTFSSSAAGIFP